MGWWFSSPHAGGLSSIPGQRTGSCIPQLGAPMLQLRFGLAKYFLKIKVEKEFVTDTVTVLNIKAHLPENEEVLIWGLHK